MQQQADGRLGPHAFWQLLAIALLLKGKSMRVCKVQNTGALDSAAVHPASGASLAALHKGGPAAVLLTVLFWCLDGTAAETPYVAPFNKMTAAELVQKLTTEPASPSDSRETDRAHYYLAGIKDGTQGVLWCFKRAMLPDELNYEIAHALKERHKAEELNANAAPLVVAELRRRYPCNGGARGGK